MILVDSGVWIDQLADRDTLQTRAFERLLIARKALCVGDLMVVEVLQGIRDERAFRAASARLSLFDRIQISDHRVAEAASRYYRTLRGMGITIRKTIDTLIATRCILDGLPLLYSDRYFDPFVRHFGLISAMAIPTE